MGALLGLSGLIGAVVSLVILAICAVKKRPKWKTVIALTLSLVLFVVGLVLPSGNKVDKSALSEENVQAEKNVQTEENIQTEENAQYDHPQNVNTAQAEESVEYVDDKVVNQFMADYDSITNSPITDISNGNIRTKYFFKTYGFNIEIINVSNADAICIDISINGDMDSHVPEMRDVFHDIVKTLDSELSDDDIYSFFDEKTVDGNCAHEATLGHLICSVFLTGNFDGNGRIDIHN